MDNQKKKLTPFGERILEAVRAQRREGGVSGIGGRWRISKVFSLEVKQSRWKSEQDLSDGGGGRGMRQGAGQVLEQWEGQRGKGSVEDTGALQGGGKESPRGGCLLPLESGRPRVLCWHLRGTVCMEVRGRESWHSLCLEGGEGNRSPTGGRKMSLEWGRGPGKFPKRGQEGGRGEASRGRAWGSQELW